MHTCDFSYLHYQQTLNEIKKNHRFSNFLNCSDNDIILRHDIDVSLTSALKIAEIKNQLGIQSTFFILIHAELYNPFNRKSNEIIKKILKLGHNLGLHYNASIIKENNLDPSKTIQKEIEVMEQHYNTEIRVISAHDPAVNKKLSIILPNGVVNAYLPEFTVNRKYFSDSVQFWREGCFCKHFHNHKKMQVLTHPIWWSEDSKNRADIMKILLIDYLDHCQQEVEYLSKKFDNYIQQMSS